MTDKTLAKRKERARNAAGYEHVGGWAKAKHADRIRKMLLTAGEVDAEIERKGKDG